MRVVYHYGYDGVGSYGVGDGSDGGNAGDDDDDLHDGYAAWPRRRVNGAAE